MVIGRGGLVRSTGGVTGRLLGGGVMPRKPSLSGSREIGEVEGGISEELGALGVCSPGLGALALQLARSIDDPGNSATSRSMCAKALMDVMRELRGLAPAEREADRVDELSSRRAARVGGGAASEG
jgi:hypothetical protein